MIFEALKGLNITDPKFYIPVIIGAILLFIIVKIAKKLAKLAIFIAVIALVLLVYFNLPSIKFDGTTAIIQVSSREYRIDAKNATIKTEKNEEGKTLVYLVSGETKIELPFSRDYAERFIMNKIREKIGLKENGGK